MKYMNNHYGMSRVFGKARCKMPMNLQYFAEGGEGDAGAEGGAGGASGTSEGTGDAGDNQGDQGAAGSSMLHMWNLAPDRLELPTIKAYLQRLR